MQPAVDVALLWLLFGGTHIGPGAQAVRGRLAARIGEVGFTALFYLVAAATFAALVAFYAAHRFEGAAGLALGTLPGSRWGLMIVVAAGMALMAPALATYPRLPSALFGRRIRAPYGIERITRHPFFAGVALLAGAHVLLATRLVGTVFFGGFLLLAVLGAWHQDGKLLARRGAPYARYLAETSAVPFAAILRGRQRLVRGELPAVALSLGLAFAVLLRTRHDALFADRGAWIIVTVVAGGSIAGLNAWRRSRRAAAPAGYAAGSAR